ncbi:MAG: twitching motility protein PilT, partial [Acidobacteria bacterium]|nr:twitching motility protein PilT [Acidobacteriota bacterium]
MNAFLDTSVLVAAFWGDHTDHESSLRLFSEAKPDTAACGIHSLAEVYATMSALPVRPLLAPEQVCLLVEQIPEHL